MRLLLAAAVLASIAPLPASAELDDDDKNWVLAVKPLLLDEEPAILASLATKADRLEFRKIFWARRDPDLLTEENEFKTLYDQRRPEADKRFYTSAYIPIARSTDTAGSQARRRSSDPIARRGTIQMEEAQIRMLRDQRERPAMEGGLTDCGLFYIVLGEPDDITKRPRTVWGLREPQVWTYKAKESQFLFDEACMLPVGNDKFRRQVQHYAIAQGAIDYHVKGGELLEKLADMMPKLTPMAQLLLVPRQDFAIGVQHYFAKADDRTTVLGLVCGEGVMLFREAAVDGRARLLVRAEAIPEEEGARPIRSEREVLAPIGPDGTFVASYRLPARAGKYRLKIAVVDANSAKGSILSQPIEVPDLGTGAMTFGPILALQAVEDKATKDPRHPMEAFRVGDLRLVPRWAHVFHPSDAVTFSYQFYDPTIDPATQKSSTVAKVRILRENGSTIGEGPEDSFDTSVSGTLVGPVSLRRYPPGKYRVQVEVTDNVAGKVLTQESGFEVVAAAGVAEASTQ